MITFFRLYWTLRYLSARQVYYRARRILRRRWQRLVNAKAQIVTGANLTKIAPLWQDFTSLPVQNEFLDAAHTIQTNQFSYLNHTVKFEAGIGWHDASLSHLFRYHLHYFHYLLPLLVSHHAGNTQAYPTFKRLVQDWINANELLKGDGWHPYTLSLRIVNWINAVNGFETELAGDAKFKQTVINSVYYQARYLAADLEHDVRGNHLLENIRALIWAGIAFEGAEAKRWVETGLYWLEKEVAEQVLPDGAHFERSPGYHVLVLQGLFEIELHLDQNDKSTPTWLQNAIERMTEYLQQVQRPDGQVPMLKDTAQDAYVLPAELLQAICPSNSTGWYANLLNRHKPTQSLPRKQAVVHLSDAGHTVLQSEKDWLIIDHGVPCPPYLPAHAQADLFTFEYFENGNPVIVDSGIYEYTRGKWRDYFRSTAAHNTVEVDGKNSTDVWHSFRAARRATPRVVEFTRSAKQTLLIVEHDGYCHRSPAVTHRRYFLWIADVGLLIADQLLGSGPVSAISRFQLHPDCTTTQIGPLQLRLTPELCFTSLDKFEFGAGWYSPAFGVKTATTKLELSIKGELPSVSAVLFSYTDQAVLSRDSATVSARIGQATYQIHILQ